MLEKENLLRAITRNDPDHVPVRRLDGSISGMARVIYRDSRALLSGTDRWGVTWAGGTAAASEWDAEIQGYPVNHPLQDLSELDTYPFPDPNEPGIMDGLMDGVDREQVLVTGEICFPVQDRAHLLMGLDNFCMAAVDQPDRVRPGFPRVAPPAIRAGPRAGPRSAAVGRDPRRSRAAGRGGRCAPARRRSVGCGAAGARAGSARLRAREPD